MKCHRRRWEIIAIENISEEQHEYADPKTSLLNTVCNSTVEMQSRKVGKSEDWFRSGDYGEAL